MKPKVGDRVRKITEPKLVGEVTRLTGTDGRVFVRFDEQPGWQSRLEYHLEISDLEPSWGSGEHVGFYSEEGYMIDAMECSCGWKSKPYFDGFPHAVKDFENHYREAQTTSDK